MIISKMKIFFLFISLKLKHKNRFIEYVYVQRSSFHSSNGGAYWSAGLRRVRSTAGTNAENVCWWLWRRIELIRILCSLIWSIE